jgi:hypothetical protein
VNNLSVIAFYPGGGGNRYLRYLQNKDFSNYNVSYDNIVVGQKSEYRYLLNPLSKPLDTNPILTHCLNSKQIIKFFGPCDITILQTDFKKSLRREWCLQGLQLYKKKVQNEVTHDLLNSVWSTITWHHNYYTQHQIDTSNCKIIDITTGSDDFAKVIQQELENYYSKLFDFCWEIYTNQGPTAPIVTLYDQHKDELS